MKKLLRMFSWDSYKGEPHYLKNQRKYEVGRTLLYFGISLAILFTGILSTGTRNNLLTIVAVLGMLPASKSLVETILFFRYRGCSETLCETLAKEALPTLNSYDRIFTGNRKNYEVSHLCVSGGSICGISEDPKFDEQGFKEHLKPILGAEHLGNLTVKIFTDPDKYIERVRQMSGEEPSDAEKAALHVLNSVSL